MRPGWDGASDTVNQTFATGAPGASIGDLASHYAATQALLHASGISLGTA
jgi:hypothetical protein